MAYTKPIWPKDLLIKLAQIRQTDDTAYICEGCGAIKNGIAARIGWGWACCEACYDKVCRAMEQADMPARR